MPDDLKAIVQRMIDAGESEDNIATVIQHGQNAHPSDSAALGAAAIAPAANIAARVATNPNLPRTMASVGRVVGALAPPVVGAYEGGPIGALAGLAGAAKGSWAGGKTGYFSGKLMQKAAAPVASGLSAIAPIAHQLSGVAGVGDLAQMAEPNRRDIGFLGVGPSVHVPGAEPPVLNRLAAYLRGRFVGQ